MLLGDSVGVSEGGVLTQPVRELTIKVKPTNIPDSIDIDASGLANWRVVISSRCA